MTSGNRHGAALGWLPRSAAMVVMAMVLAACGVDQQSSPEPVPQDRLPRVMPTASGGTGAVRSRVWGVREQRLVPVFVSLSDTDVMTRLQALIELGSPGQQPATAMARGTRVVSVVQRDRVVVVRLSTEFRQTPAKDVPLALAQVVLTVTEQPDVDEVEIRVGESTVPLLDEQGRTLSRPLRRSDFEGLVEGGRID